MAAAGRTTPSDPAPAEAAARLDAAPFVRLVGVGTGAGLVATGLLAGALGAAAVPFQASVGPLAGTESTTTGDDGDLTLAVGRPGLPADLALGGDEPTPAVAYDVAAELEGADPSPVLALAGLVAADLGSPESRPALVEAAGLERRPGLGLPVPDPTTGLAYTTLLHTDASGDPEAVAERFGIDDESNGRTDEDEGQSGETAEAEGRALASKAALAVAAGEAPAAAGEAVEVAMHPYVGGPVETVAAYADVLRALAARAPGLGIQIAMTSEAGGGGDLDAVSEALAHWRDHGEATHEAVSASETARHDGLVVATAGDAGPSWAVARLLRDYVSPEPVVVHVGTAAAIATTRGDPEAFAAAVDTAAGRVDGRIVTAGTRARAVLDDPDTFADALREAI
ncbi:MAG: hypothetical protein V5A43_05795 [Haloarculaceae archaeon]